MRKPVLLISVNAIILIFVFVLLAQSLLVNSRLAQADRVQGIVQVQRAGTGSFVALNKGQPVAVGDVVRTGNNGQVEFNWPDKTRWKLMSNARLTIDQASVNNAKDSENSQFQLDAGKLFVRIVKSVKAGSSFAVQTPNALVQVVGTVFSVDVQADGETKVETFAGRVQVNSAGKRVYVDRGNAATAGANSIVMTRTSGADFRLQPDLVRPLLNAIVQPMNKDIVIIKGVTEAGNTLEINKQKALMLANGSFARRFTLAPGHNQWQIVTTDKHGAKSIACRALNYDASADKTSPSSCR